MRTVTLFSIFCVVTLAKEVVWVKLAPQFSYRDLWQHCDNQTYPGTLYFSAEAENVSGKWEVKSALLQKTKVSKPQPGSMLFKSEELRDLEIDQDSKGKFLLRALPLSGRLLHWVFFNAGTGFSGLGCVPSQPLSSIDPEAHLYRFGGSEIGVQSELQIFRGYRKDGYAYVAELQFKQQSL